MGKRLGVVGSLVGPVQSSFIVHGLDGDMCLVWVVCIGFGIVSGCGGSIFIQSRGGFVCLCVDHGFLFESGTEFLPEFFLLLFLLLLE